MNVYLDYAATSPLRAEVLERMLPCLKENFGNPDSLHAYGRRAAFLVTEARDRIAEVLGVRPNEIYFTSGGTEADNWAVCGLSQDGGVLASSIEHAAVLTPLSRLPRCAVCRTGEDGVLSPAALAEALSGREISLVAVMAVNNETGVIQPVPELAAAAHEQGALFFSDCVQARCCDLKALTAVCDAVSLSAHKLGGPKGVGLLWVRKGVRLSPLIAGGEQERALRGGTLNVAGIVGMAEALSLARSEREAFISHTRSLRDAFEAHILSALNGEARIDGVEAERAPNLSHITFARGGEWLLSALDLRGIACSGGAACSAHAARPSHVMLAMGRTEEEAKRGVRFSFGQETTAEEMRFAAETVAEILRERR